MMPQLGTYFVIAANYVTQAIAPGYHNLYQNQGSILLYWKMATLGHKER